MQAQNICDEQFFIPNGYNLFRIKETTLGENTAAKIHIRSRILPYPSDAATLQDLVAIFMEEYGIKAGRFGAGRGVFLGLEGVGKLPMEVHVFELKSRLNHLSLKCLELIPFLSNKDAFNYECFTALNFKGNPQYKPPGGDNTIEICIELPQLHQLYYCDLLAVCPLEDELKKLLKQKQQQIGKDLSQMRYKAICKGCGEQADTKLEVCQLFQTHFAIDLVFDRLEQLPQPKPLTKVQLEIMQGVEKTVRVIPYAAVARKQVKTILEEVRVENADKLGLRILGVNLRPGDLLSRVESQLAVLLEGRVQAYIMEESELFYSIGPELMRIPFDLQELAVQQEVAAKQGKDSILREIYERRQLRISEIEQQQQSRRRPKEHRESSFLDPLLGYTSPYFYEGLNKYLRDTNFCVVPESSYQRVQYKLSFAIVRSLLMLPGYSGKTYRGLRDFRDSLAKVGSIIYINAFTSTSTNPEKARVFGASTFYTIFSVTGRLISEYSYFRTEAEVLFMPYTYFQVLEIKNTPESLMITMREIPMPRRSNSNMIMWVDDDTTEGSKICENLQLNYPGLTTEVIQITSNEHLRVWLSKFGHCAKERRKVTLITDLKRGEELAAGLETIETMQRVMGRGLEVFLYVFNLDPALELLANKGVHLSPTLAIGKTRREVMQFITEKAVQKEELTSDTCQLI